MGPSTRRSGAINQVKYRGSYGHQSAEPYGSSRSYDGSLRSHFGSRILVSHDIKLALFCMGIDLAGASFSGIVIGWLASAYHHYQDALEAVTRLAGPLDAVSKLAGACSERCPSCPILVPPSCAPVICQDDAGTQRGLFLVSGLGLGLFIGTLLGLRLGRPVAPASRVVHVPGLVPLPPVPARAAVATRRVAPPLRRLSVDASSW